MDVMKNQKRAAVLFAALIVIGAIVCAISGGLRTGTAYTGGTLITVSVKADYDMKVVESALRENGAANAQVQRAGNQRNLAEIRLQESGDAAALAAKLEQSIAKTYAGAKVSSTKAITAAYSGTLFVSLLLPALAACVVAFVYAWARYGVQAGISAAVTVCGTLLALLAIMGITRIVISPAFISAWLLVAGWAVYGIYVLYERIWDGYLGDPQAEKRRGAIVNASVMANLPHMLAVAAGLTLVLCALAVFGGAGLLGFAVPGIIGLVAGSVLLIFFAAPLWATLQMNAAPAKTPRKKTNKKKK